MGRCNITQRCQRTAICMLEITMHLTQQASQTSTSKSCLIAAQGAPCIMRITNHTFQSLLMHLL